MKKRKKKERKEARDYWIVDVIFSFIDVILLGIRKITRLLFQFWN
ncbi:hypothetical protein [Aquisalibacillus elongatus]|nr:hypothetical protein [Aquisalibacillus elongatus]